MGAMTDNSAISANPDWEHARERLTAFWEHELIDRPCVQVYVDPPWIPAAAADLAELGVSATDYWTRPDSFFQVERHRYRRRQFLGDALPVLYPNWAGVPQMMGAQVVYDAETLWVHAPAETPGEVSGSGLRVDAPEVDDLVGWLSHCAEQGAGECFVGFPAMGNAGDHLAQVLDYQNLCLALYDDPEGVLRLEAAITQLWKGVYDRAFTAINGHMAGSCGWLPAWHPRRSALIEFDFAAMISPDQFRLFLPHLIERAEYVERSIYHVDGPDALIHLDTILAQPEFDAIQWEPGAGGGGLLEWLPVLHRIQAAGKCLYVGYHGWRPDEVLQAFRELDPAGVILPVQTHSADEAQRFLDAVAAL